MNAGETGSIENSPNPAMVRVEIRGSSFFTLSTIKIKSLVDMIWRFLLKLLRGHMMQLKLHSVEVSIRISRVRVSIDRV
jgi:hypothetical protein